MATQKPNLKIPVSRAIAVALLINGWNPQSQAGVARRLFRLRQPWLVPLTERITQSFPSKPSLSSLEKFINADIDFRTAVKVNNLKPIDPRKVLGDRPIAAVNWNLPDIPGFRELAKWLDISPIELEWLSNIGSPNSNWRAKRPRHYVVSAIEKRSRGVRLIESPKQKLKQVQRKINEQILSRITPHVSAHGFCKDRSVISYVEPHIGKRFCLKLDLKDFFPTIKFARIIGLFKTLGFVREVRYCLAALCTNSVDADSIFRATGIPQTAFSRTSRLYLPRHLPQGAPTSPAIANLIAYRFDARLSGLANSTNTTYTRYADDLLFSGNRDFEIGANRFVTTIGALAIEEGFQIHFRKTRLMRASPRQKATGIVINQKLNFDRKDFDQLKAILTNCKRLGPGGQNRESHSDFAAHLQGRIEWVRQLNPAKAKKLQAIFAGIDWS